MKTKTLFLTLCAALLSLSARPVPARDGVWSTNAPLPGARSSPAAAVVNGALYVLGGGNDPCSGLVTMVAFNPATSQWTPKMPMPAPRYKMSIGVVNGDLYAVGGANLRAAGLAELEVYDPASDTWTTKAPMPTARNRLAVAAVNGVLYALGGCTDNACANFVGTVEAYDPARNTWTNCAPMPTARRDFAVAVVNGLIYASGGSQGPGSGALDSVEVYDPASNTWTAKPPMPTPRTSHAAAALNGLLYVMGGHSLPDNFATVDVFDPAANARQPRPSLPGPRTGLAAVSLNGRVYTIGGSVVDVGVTNLVEAFAPGDATSVVMTDPLPPHTTLAGAAPPPGWSCTLPSLGSHGTITCAGPRLRPGESAQFRVNVRVDGSLAESLLLTNTATVSATQFDPHRADNNATAVVQVVVPPQFTTQPLHATASPGGTVTFSVEATGGALSYQWYRNGQLIAGATSATLVVQNKTAEDAGEYTVAVSNAAGSVTSSVAILTCFGVKMYAGLTIAGPVGRVYRIDYRNDLRPTNHWTALTTVTLSHSLYLFLDFDSPNAPRRFYRAVLLP